MRDDQENPQGTRELASAAGEFVIGNDLRVTRLGFGAMRITGDGVWGEPKSRTKPSRFCAVPWNSESI